MKNNSIIKLVLGASLIFVIGIISYRSKNIEKNEKKTEQKNDMPVTATADVGTVKDSSGNSGKSEKISDSDVSATPVVPAVQGIIIDNGFEPDDGAPIPSAEDQVRNNVIEARVEFSEDDISVTRRGEYDYVEMKEALNGLAEPGSPDLPVYSFTLLIPRGRVIDDISVKLNEVTWKHDVFVSPAQPPRIPDGSPPPPFVPPDSAVYAKDELVPSVPVEDSVSQGVRGYTVVPVNVHPVRYNPVSGELTRVTSLKVELTTRDMTDEERSNAFMPRSNKHFDDSVRGIVSNSEIMDIQVLQNN
ncbi:C25 family peptidase propeptide domain-containing protein [Verrucomicrobiota bacterium]